MWHLRTHGDYWFQFGGAVRKNNRSLYRHQYFFVDRRYWYSYRRDRRCEPYYDYYGKRKNEGNRNSKSDRCHSRYDHSRSEEHTSELQSRGLLVCRLLLDKKAESQ